MRDTLALTLSLLLGTASIAGAASAQELTSAERAAAVGRARAMADCIGRSHEQIQRLLRLLGQAEGQRDGARDAAARRDAEHAVEALVTRMSQVQVDARECLAGDALPTVGTQVIVQPPAPDPAADAVAGSGGSIQTIESDASLTSRVRVVRAQQVDGQGRLDPGLVRSALRSIGARLDQCYERYLERGSVQARSLDLVFGLRGSGPARSVSVERSAFSDADFERCVVSAGQHIRVSSQPTGGEAIYSYTLLFGRAP